MLFLVIPVASFGEIVTIKVDGIRELSSKIPSSKVEKVDSLKVIGDLSDLDFRFLNVSMTGLHYLDLSEANIVASDGKYWFNGEVNANIGQVLHRDVIHYFLFAMYNHYTEIIFPNSALYMECGAWSAISNCKNLTKVTLGRDLRGFVQKDSTTPVLPYQIFTSVYGVIEEVWVHPENEYFTSENGVLYDKEMKTLLYLPSEYKSKSFTVPSSVERLEECCMNSSFKLKELHLPATIKQYPDKLMSSALSPTAIYVYATTPPEVSSHLFGSDKQYSTLYVPKGCKSAYEWAIGWGDFPVIKEFEPSGLTPTISDVQPQTKTYNLSGQEADANGKGIYIVGGKKILNSK